MANQLDYSIDKQLSRPRLFWTLLVIGGLVALGGLFSFFNLEHYGHVITGMNNQVVWGLPHVFAVFLIVAASGVLNVASIGSVFGKKVYKARAPLSGLLALAMLAGGLSILVMDLGRPDRLIVALTHFNFMSIFALNMILYNGFFAIVGLYLVALMDRKMGGYVKPLGILAFLWRLALTTGTGSIFGFLVARSSFDSALMAPMFVIFSFAYGLAIFLVVQSVMYWWNGISLDERVLARMKNLLAVFVSAALYFTVVFHMTNLYFAKEWSFERFFLLDGGIYTQVFWVGQIFLGGVLPLILLFQPAAGKKETLVFIASLLVILGGLAQMYATIIGGQAYPLNLFPGYAQTSSFFDGQIHNYVPSIWELLLGLGGLAIAFLITVVAVRVLRFLPQDDFKALESGEA